MRRSLLRGDSDVIERAKNDVRPRSSGISLGLRICRGERRPVRYLMDRISLSRHSRSDGGCSMKITEDVRKYASELGIAESEALKKGLKEKSAEFVEKGEAVYLEI